MSVQVYEDIFLGILNEIELALENKLFLAALSLAVTIPDICGEAEFSKQGKPQYIKWYNEHIGNKAKPSGLGKDMPYVSGEIVYYLRNSLLHNGNPNVNKEKVSDERCKIDRFEMIVGENNYRQTSKVKYGGEHGIYYRSIVMNVTVFCRHMVEAAREFYFDNKDRFQFDYSFSQEDLPDSPVKQQADNE